MDPDSTLAAIRQIADVCESQQRPLDDNESATLAGLINALDTWITRGGYLPTAWNHPTEKGHTAP